MRAAGHATTGPTSLLAVLVAALLGGVGSLAWLVLLPAPAGAAAKPCIGVIVDARLLGGDVRTGCAVGDPDSGLEALTKAGFGYAFVPRQPGLVCQIDRAPECTRTTTTTYWSYWYRAKGSQTWVYSSAGAASHDPAPGSTEAWVWQEGGRKAPPDIALTTVCPQAAGEPTATRTAKKTPSPTSSARSSTRSATTSPSQRATTTSRKAATKKAATKKAAKNTVTPTAESTPPATPDKTSEPSGTTASSSDPDTGTSPQSTAPAAATGAPADPDSGGPPWVGLLVGAGLVAGLGGAALARSRRSGGAP